MRQFPASVKVTTGHLLDDMLDNFLNPVSIRITTGRLLDETPGQFPYHET
jgi:hypothetical protein